MTAPWLSALHAQAAAAPWSVTLAYFDALRFALTVLAATWLFMRGTPLRDRAGRRAAAAIGAQSLLAVGYATLLPSANLSGSPISAIAMTQVWIFCTFMVALLAAHHRHHITWTNALSRWLLGICVERFVTAFVHNWLFLVIIPDFKTTHPTAYMAICVFIYTLFLTAAGLLLAPVFRRDMAAGASESRALCAIYTASFLALYLISSASMHISEYWVPRLRLGHGDDAGLDSILRFSISMAGVIATVIVLFQYTIHHTIALRQESDMLNLLAEQRSRQYATLSDNIEFINRKTHDLKHQIAALEFTDDARRGAMVHEVQQALNLYDSRAETGNEALDALLTERGFYCARNGVRLSCMLKGCDWSAFDVVDLYTLIGNALDNALEYVTRFDDPDKRVVSLTAQQHGELIVISVDNHFEGTLTLRDGLPATSKADSTSHGLGLKSIRRIARGYDGDIQISAAPPVFTLQISLMAAAR